MGWIRNYRAKGQILFCLALKRGTKCCSMETNDGRRKCLNVLKSERNPAARGLVRLWKSGPQENRKDIKESPGKDIYRLVQSTVYRHSLIRRWQVATAFISRLFQKQTVATTFFSMAFIETLLGLLPNMAGWGSLFPVLRWPNSSPNANNAPFDHLSEASHSCLCSHVQPGTYTPPLLLCASLHTTPRRPPEPGVPSFPPSNLFGSLISPQGREGFRIAAIYNP